MFNQLKTSTKKPIGFKFYYRNYNQKMNASQRENIFEIFVINYEFDFILNVIKVIIRQNLSQNFPNVTGIYKSFSLWGKLINIS